MGQISRVEGWERRKMEEKDWTEMMIELIATLEEANDAGLTKEEVLQEVDNVFKDEREKS
jgi:hypothetical protein